MLQKLVFVFVLLSHGELFMNKLAVSCIEQIKNSLYSMSKQFKNSLCVFIKCSWFENNCYLVKCDRV